MTRFFATQIQDLRESVDLAHAVGRLDYYDWRSVIAFIDEIEMGTIYD